MDEPVGVCMRRLRYQLHATAPNTATTATSRQTPSASPIARPGPASWVVAESLVPFTPTSGEGEGSGGEGGGEGEGGSGGGGDGGGEGEGGGTVVKAEAEAEAEAEP